MTGAGAGIVWTREKIKEVFGTQPEKIFKTPPKSDQIIILRIQYFIISKKKLFV